MEQKITIRKMQRADKPAILRMMRTFYDSPAVSHTAPDAVLIRDIDDALSELPYIEGFTIGDAGRIIGYALVSVGYTTEYGGICIWLEDLYLEPAYRHCGIAGALFACLEQTYPDAVRFKLQVEPENVYAVQCYEKYGYRRSPYLLMTHERCDAQS